jgi:hypothetical protein
MTNSPTLPSTDNDDQPVTKRITIYSPFKLDVMNRRILGSDKRVISTAQYIGKAQGDYVYYAEVTVLKSLSDLHMAVPAYASVEIR